MYVKTQNRLGRAARILLPIMAAIAVALILTSRDRASGQNESRNRVRTPEGRPVPDDTADSRADTDGRTPGDREETRSSNDRLLERRGHTGRTGLEDRPQRDDARGLGMNSGGHLPRRTSPEAESFDRTRADGHIPASQVDQPRHRARRADGRTESTPAAPKGESESGYDRKLSVGQILTPGPAGLATVLLAFRGSALEWGAYFNAAVIFYLAIRYSPPGGTALVIGFTIVGLSMAALVVGLSDVVGRGGWLDSVSIVLKSICTFVFVSIGHGVATLLKYGFEELTQPEVAHSAMTGPSLTGSLSPVRETA